MLKQSFLLHFIRKEMINFAGRMEKVAYIIIALCMLFACDGNRQHEDMLMRARTVMNEHPDSALAILDSLYCNKAEMNRHFRMQVLLHRTEAQNKLFTQFPSDSIQTELVDYFDRHGTRNERMLAHYLLGCVLSDLGDSPEALQAFYDAIEMADTTRTDCDLYTLRVVYGQMAMLYHNQNLPNDEIRALQRYINLTEKLCSEEEVIIAKGELERPYFLLDMKDSIVSLELWEYNELKRIGKEKIAGGCLTCAPYFYLMQGETAKAKELMDLYEQAVMDSSGNVNHGCEAYYYFKGLYEQTVGHLDAAEYWYRRAEEFPNLRYTYKGLLRLFHQKHNADSVFKYAQLFEDATDSLHNKMRTDAVRQMSALYDYSRSRQQAEQEAAKARTAWMWLWMLGLLALVLQIFGIWLYRLRQRQNRNRILHLKMVQRDIQRNSNATIAANNRKIEELGQQMASLQETHSDTLTQLEDYKKQLEAQNAIAKAEQDSKLQTDKALKTTAAYAIVKDRVQSGSIIAKAEWQEIETTIHDSYPDFRERIEILCSLSEHEYHVCLLLKMGVEPSRIADLTAHTKASVTQTRKRLYKKCFGEAGMGEQWDEFIKSL